MKKLLLLISLLACNFLFAQQQDSVISTVIDSAVVVQVDTFKIIKPVYQPIIKTKYLHDTIQIRADGDTVRKLELAVCRKANWAIAQQMDELKDTLRLRSILMWITFLLLAVITVYLIRKK